MAGVFNIKATKLGSYVSLAICNVTRHIKNIMCRAWLCEVNLPYLFLEPS